MRIIPEDEIKEIFSINDNYLIKEYQFQKTGIKSLVFSQKKRN